MCAAEMRPLPSVSVPGAPGQTASSSIAPSSPTEGSKITSRRSSSIVATPCVIETVPAGIAAHDATAPVEPFSEPSPCCPSHTFGVLPGEQLPRTHCQPEGHCEFEVHCGG